MFHIHVCINRVLTEISALAPLGSSAAQGEKNVNCRIFWGGNVFQNKMLKKKIKHFLYQNAILSFFHCFRVTQNHIIISVFRRYFIEIQRICITWEAISYLLVYAWMYRPYRWRHVVPQRVSNYRGADKFLARPGRKQATATEDFEFHISYL